MIVRLVCPSGHVLDVDTRLAGRKIRCGGCGKIMVVPGAPRGAVKKPPARPIAKPPAPAAKPLAAPIAKPQAVRAAPSTPPTLPAEYPLGGSPLPAPRSSLPAPRSPLPPPSSPPFAWLRKFWPGTMSGTMSGTMYPWSWSWSWSAEKHLPADVTIPGKAERRTAFQVAGVTAGAALAGLLPVFGLGHANLLTAPPWALAAVFLAVLQLVYAAWMINVPDWVAARVQMVVCAVLATIYGMLMTLTMIAPLNHPLILGLDEVRRAAPAWCGLMLALAGAATWFCGRTSARWRGRRGT